MRLGAALIGWLDVSAHIWSLPAVRLSQIACKTINTLPHLSNCCISWWYPHLKRWRLPKKMGMELWTSVCHHRLLLYHKYVQGRKFMQHLFLRIWSIILSRLC